jgi:hypothetical protein
VHIEKPVYIDGPVCYINSTEDKNQPNDAPAPPPEEKERIKGNNLVDDEELQAIIPRQVLDLLDDIADDDNDDGDDDDNDGKGGAHDGDRDDNDDDDND